MAKEASASARQTAREIIEPTLGRGASVLEETSSEALAAAYGIPVADEATRSSVQRSASARQFLVGMKRDPSFGPVVSFGLGGVLAEAVKEVALGLAPLEEGEATELLGSTRAGGLLGSVGDLPAVDQKALVGVIRAVGQMAMDNPEIAQIDINPLVAEDRVPVAAGLQVTLEHPTEPRKRDRRAFKPNMAALMAPRSVAVVGASGEMSRWGGSVLRNILDGGYSGRVYPVNAKGGVFFGLQASLGLEELPEPPDLVLLAVAEQQIASVVRECVRKRVGAVVVMPSDSKNVGTAESTVDEAVARIATEGAVTLVDSGCLGLVSNEVGLHAVGSIELHPPGGKLSLVSQSGDMGALMAKTCERQGIGVDKFVSVGQEVQIGVAEVLDHMRDDPHTSCIAMCLEDLSDGRRFVEAARKAAAFKPVVVLHVGLTGHEDDAPSLQAEAKAEADRLWEAAARRAGVVACANLEELVNTGACLAYLPLPRGRRVAVVGRRRGAGILAMDEVLRCGLVPAELPDELRSSVEQLATSWCAQNPLDPAAETDEEMTDRVIRSVVECDAVDAVILNPIYRARGSVVAGSSPEPDAGDEDRAAWRRSLLESVARLMEETDKPILPAPNPCTHGSVLDLGSKYSPVVLPSARAAALALDKMERYASTRRERAAL